MSINLIVDFNFASVEIAEEEVKLLEEAEVTITLPDGRSITRSIIDLSEDCGYGTYVCFTYVKRNRGGENT
jgi:hypothetical protein